MKIKENIINELYKVKINYDMEFDTLIYDAVLWLENEINTPDLKQSMLLSDEKNNLNNTSIKQNNKSRLLSFFNNKREINLDTSIDIISVRQECCYNLAMKNLHDNKLSSSFHEIRDFIHNYRKNLDKPLSTMERLLIYFWIKSFKYIYVKNLELINNSTSTGEL